MKNVNQLREELSKCFAECKSGELSPVTMGKLNQTASTIINSARVELEYNKFTDNNRKIEFLED